MPFTGTDIPAILSTLRQECDPQLANSFYAFEDLYQRKLFHQLTLSLIEFYRNPLSDPIKLRLYNNFISKFKYKINLLKLVEFLIASLETLKDSKESLIYLNELKTDLTDQKKLDKEQALILVDIEIAKYELQSGGILKAREILDSIDEILKNLDSIDLKLNQSFFQTNSEYYKVKSDYNNFYYQSLLYLSTLASVDELSPFNQQKLAYELSISVLLGDKIYNFGELLTHPILTTLENGEYAWLVDILHSLNSGNLQKFSKNLVHLPKVTILKHSEPFLRQKICLMTLVELVFSQTIRIISFQDVSKATLLNLDEVEHLVMRALSLGLLKGSIDQINQLITINWVQPRIVNKEQIDAMKKKLIDWDSNVSKLGQFMEANGKDIWIQ